MNDDTVPDVGMTVGFDGVKVPSQSWRKCLLSAFALAAFCADAEVEMIGNIEWQYSVDENGKAEINSALDYAPEIPYYVSGSVTIPSTLGGYPVVSIGRNAFDSCDDLVSVTIPEGVETIGTEAFYGCRKLSSISIPDSVTSVGVDAFAGCSSALYDPSTAMEVKMVDGWVVGRGTKSTLENLNIPQARGIVDEAFSFDRELVRVAIPGGIPAVPSKAFYRCRTLKTVVFLGDVGEIGKSAFRECSRLVEVIRMSGVTNIASAAFAECTTLERIILPATVRSIESKAFYDCKLLSDVEIQGDMPKIGDNAFARTKVHIREGVIIRVEVSDDEDVPEYQTALEGAADERLLQNITSDAEYASFQTWIGGLEGTTIEEVKASPCAWLSYALGSASLIAFAPTSEDVRIVRFVPSGGTNAFDLSVSVAGVSVGSAATAANLGKVFAVEGAETLTESMFSTNSVNVAFGTPSDGLLKLSVSPKDLSAKSFFFRVKLK